MREIQRPERPHIPLVHMKELPTGGKIIVNHVEYFAFDARRETR
jgi:hypothetical protein